MVRTFGAIVVFSASVFVEVAFPSYTSAYAIELCYHHAISATYILKLWELQLIFSNLA